MLYLLSVRPDISLIVNGGNLSEKKYGYGYGYGHTH